MSLPFESLSHRLWQRINDIILRFHCYIQYLIGYLQSHLDCDGGKLSCHSQKFFWLWRFQKVPQPKIIFGCGGFKKFHSRKKFWLWPFSEHQKNGCGKIEISFWLWNLYGPGEIQWKVQSNSEKIEGESWHVRIKPIIRVYQCDENWFNSAVPLSRVHFFLIFST